MDLFRRRKNHNEVQQFLVRFANERQKDANQIVHEKRCSARAKNNLNVGVWVVPFVDGQPDCDDSFVAVTSDVGWNGIGILADRPSTAEELVLVFSTERGRTFLRVKIHACTPLGVGFYRLGTEATEVVSLEEFSELEQVGLAAAV